MGSNVKQCKQCGILFQSMGSNICPNCAEEMDRQFHTVKNYLYDNPEANVFDIARDTGVAENLILRFLREGLLTVSVADGSLTCEECGTPITGGRYCSTCERRLENVLIGAIKQDPRKQADTHKNATGARMHVSVKS